MLGELLPGVAAVGPGIPVGQAAQGAEVHRGPPVVPGSTSMADYVSGMWGAIGVLTALRARETSGRGQFIVRIGDAGPVVVE